MKLVLLFVALCQAAAPVRLSPSFMAQVMSRLQSVPATAGLAAAYKANPIPVYLQKPDVSSFGLNKAIGTYNYDKTVSLNQDVFGPNVTPDDVAATVGHELTHWQNDEKLADAASVHNELESHHNQVMYALGRLKEDPDYFDGSKSWRRKDYDITAAWLTGPDGFYNYVADSYPHLPENFREPEVQLEKAQAALQNGLKAREQRARLEELEKAVHDNGMKMPRKLKKQLSWLPPVSVLDPALEALADKVMFWADPLRVQAAREHYTAFMARMEADMEAFKRDNPGFKLPELKGIEGFVRRLDKWLARLIS